MRLAARRPRSDTLLRSLDVGARQRPNVIDKQRGAAAAVKQRQGVESPQLSRPSQPATLLD
jgi:hypothetical protein